MIFSLQRILFAYSLCFFVTQLSSMEITESTKPTIIAELSINQYCAKTAFYSLPKEHTELTEMGIPSCIQYPLMPVIIEGKGLQELYNLSGKVPRQVYQFETDQYKARGIEINEEIAAEIAKKKFPLYIPAHYLCCAKTGTVLSFTIHGYAVQLTCCDSKPSSKQTPILPFEKDYARYMTNFIAQPHWLYIGDQSALIKHELIEKICDGYIHGKKGFVSMQKLIWELLHEKSRSVILLLWPFWKNA